MGWPPGTPLYSIHSTRQRELQDIHEQEELEEKQIDFLLGRGPHVLLWASLPSPDMQSIWRGQ